MRTLLAVFCLFSLVAHAQTDGVRRDMPGSIVARDAIVGPDDTLDTIARRELGRTGLAPHLAAFNNLPLTASLRAGEIIRIPQYVPRRNESVTVVFVKGSVTRNGEPLARESEVFLDDRIEVGEDGFVTLLFQSGTVVNLQPDTRVELTRLDCPEDASSCLVEISTEGGEIDSEVENRTGQSSDFRILTPFASAAVRGTAFNLALAESELRLGVTDGEVGVAADGEDVSIESGFGLLARAGEPLGVPVALPAAPVFRYVPVRAAGADDRVVWFPTELAERYEAALSEDLAGNRVVAQFVGSGSNVSVPSIEPSDYYLQFRAVGEAGIPGFSSTARLSIAAVDERVAPVDVRLTRDGSDLLVEVIDPPETADGFEIQIATAEDFTVPLAVDVGPAGAAVFRLDDDTVFARARTLVDPLTVSAFGEVASLD